jgi:transcriptional regulator with XRE-family HTH domain
MLRRAREELGLSLRDVSRSSGGRFTASGIAGYERGERRISVERLCELAEVYGTTPERLLADATAPTRAVPRRIDLSAVESLSPDVRHLIADEIEHVLAPAGEPASDQISVRLGDLEILAGTAGRSAADLLKRIREALVRDGLSDDVGETGA